MSDVNLAMPTRPVKGRPSGWWFVVGVALLVAGAAAGVLLFLRIFDHGLFDVDATVPGDGRPHVVAVGTDGDRFLWEPDDGPRAADCTIRDRATGDEIVQQGLSGTYSRSNGSGSWRAPARFDPGSGDLTITCRGAPVQIGPAWDVGRFVRDLLVAILVPLVLVGAGLTALMVTGILVALRPRRTATH